MREILEKCNKKKFYIFTGTAIDYAYNRLVIKDVSVFDTAGKHLGDIDHMLTAIKPFREKSVKINDIVRFTGKVSKYMRKDLTEDYQVLINKVRKEGGDQSFIA